MTAFTINNLFDKAKFAPNENQLQAILHGGSPLFLIAGPGSGKTRVLLWRTLNLLVFDEIPPDEIYLSTFTEKAALQLKEGLLSLLGLASNYTGKSYDISKMYVGTVHSLCQRLITDRRFAEDRSRRKAPNLLDELDQYFFLYSNKFWQDATAELALPENFHEQINVFFGKKSSSKHLAVQTCISLFNRFSEERIDPVTAKGRADDPLIQQLAELYAFYLIRLSSGGRQQVDFSLLQQHAFSTICQAPDAGHVFKHVIIDEYQDTNSIQEQIFFKLAAGHQNICVVGDDDQALYRFRGATVENFVQFPQRCQQYLSTVPTPIKLATNYRSRQEIVRFYSRFIDLEDWTRDYEKKLFYRLVDKGIKAHNEDERPSVIASSKLSSEQVAEQIANFVKRLIDEKKVADPNQIAFLYPSLGSEHARRMKVALEEVGLKVYAPRAGRFLECDEPTQVFGLFLKVIGRPARGAFPGADYSDFHDWLDRCEAEAGRQISDDKLLKAYVEEKHAEIERLKSDFSLLMAQLKELGWTHDDPYTPDKHKRALWSTPGLSDKAKRSIGSSILDKIAIQRIAEGNPFKISYVINRATSPDWSVLDLFYRFCGFGHFKEMFDVAERGEDEGMVCNLGLISEYLGRFVEKYGSVITGSFLDGDKFQMSFVASYLFAIFRLGETEYEDADDPFPKGRIPFLTIHQSKGLEFPVVVLGNPRKDDRGPQKVETVVRPMLGAEGEPLNRIAGFDIMRMFYVALSRAKNLMIVAHPTGQGVRIHPAIRSLLDNGVQRIPDFDLNTLPAAKEEKSDMAKAYSYTGDYLLFQQCPRQYMIFRKYDFVPSRSQMMFFGSLVHRTIEDLHNRLIAMKEAL